MKASEFFRKVQFPVMIALGTYCVGACIAAYLAPEALDLMWRFPGTYLLFAAVGLLLPGRLRIPLSILGAAALLAPVVLFLEGSGRMLGLILSVLYSAVLVWSMSIGGWEREREIPGGWLGAGLVFLLMGCFFATFETRMQHLLPWIQASLFLFVLLAMLSLNRRSRLLASGGRQGYSAAMRRKNVMLTLGMFAIALAVALIPSLFDLLETVWEWITELVAKLIAMFPEETETTGTSATTEVYTGAGMEGLLDGWEANRTPEQVYAMIWAIVTVVMLPLSCVVLYKLYKLARKVLRKLYATVTDGVTADAEDFLDEITDTRTDGEAAYARTEKRAALKTPPGRMTPAQQIRFRYQRLAQKHPEWGEQSTARENLHEAAARLYERARYSDHPVNQADAERFKNETIKK